MRTRVWMVLIPILVAGTLAVRAEPEEGACDMKTIVKGFYCETCEEAMLAKDLVSDVVSYTCPDCDDTSDKPGRCEWCDKELVKKVSGKNVCKNCLQAPVEAELCEKTYFACPDCGMRRPEAGTCESCEVDLVKQVSRMAIFYVCPECGESSMKPGNCTDESCEHHGKPLKKECSGSGEFPHGG